MDYIMGLASSYNNGKKKKKKKKEERETTDLIQQPKCQKLEAEITRSLPDQPVQCPSWKLLKTLLAADSASVAMYTPKKSNSASMTMFTLKSFRPRWPCTH